MGAKEGGSVQIWLPSIPTLLSPSGCHMCPEIIFQMLCSLQALLTRVSAFDLFFSPVLSSMWDISFMTRY